MEVEDAVPKPCCSCDTATGQCGGHRNWVLPCCGLNVLAAKSHAGDVVVLRVVNSGIAPYNISLDVAGELDAAGATLAVTTLASATGVAEGPDTDNPVWQPGRHAPVVSAARPFDPREQLVAPPTSFSVYALSLRPGWPGL